jgi:hypothetical protein
MRIPTGMLASGQRPRVSRYTHGNITPIFNTLYAKAEYGDITRIKPEDLLAKTSVLFKVPPPKAQDGCCFGRILD